MWTRLRGLAGGPVPLVALSQADGFPRHPESLDRLAHVTLHLTPVGAAVLAGGQGWVALGSVDRWVGGVRLGERVWRWDPERARLAAP